MARDYSRGGARTVTVYCATRAPLASAA